MFQETIREFNYNLRARFVDNMWVLERKFGFFWFRIKDDRGRDSFSAISDAVIALSRIANKYGRE